MRARRHAVDALAAVLGAGGLALIVIGAAPAPDPAAAGRSAPSAAGRAAPSAATVAPGSGAPASSAGPASPRGVPASVPVGLDIPAIGVHTGLMELGLNPDGTVAVPPLRAGAPAGWYRDLKTPGEVGPAVILGHVDTAHDGPAVFYRLHELRPGDAVTVRRQDGSAVDFAVDRVVEVAKSDFPTGEVYGPVAYPALRLVTCGGTFDRRHRTYRGNVLVYARLARA